MDSITDIHCNHKSFLNQSFTAKHTVNASERRLDIKITTNHVVSLDYDIHLVSTDIADVWIIEEQGDYDYVYGGTRKVSLQFSYGSIEEELVRLMAYESHLKNILINRAVSQGAVDDFEALLPLGFCEAKVGGARCLFRAKNKELDELMSDPTHPEFDTTIQHLFESVGEFLNRKRGQIKLTPDFGKFAGVSDTLNMYTQNVLGIKCENGGCGGKASYTATGIITALEMLNIQHDKLLPVTLIGSGGALGTNICQYMIDNNYSDFKICDLNYTENTLDFPGCNGENVSLNILPAKLGEFTEPCLSRGGTIIATTFGKELENSNLKAIPPGTKVVLAHNLALPKGREGVRLARVIEENECQIIPGQILTLGGALASRLEWFSRKDDCRIEFDKDLAHKIVRQVITHLIDAVEVSSGRTFYEKMLDFAALQVN